MDYPNEGRFVTFLGDVPSQVREAILAECCQGIDVSNGVCIDLREINRRLKCAVAKRGLPRDAQLNVRHILQHDIYRRFPAKAATNKLQLETGSEVSVPSVQFPRRMTDFLMPVVQASRRLSLARLLATFKTGAKNLTHGTAGAILSPLGALQRKHPK